MNKLYSVVLISPFGDPFTEAVDLGLSEVGDWIRVCHNFWYCWTPQSAPQLRDLLVKNFVIEAQTQFVINAVSPQLANGRAAPWIWEWLNRRMQEQLQNSFIESR